jgi:hypothetical protein
MHRFRVLSVGASLGAVALTACATNSAPHTVLVQAHEYAFTAPDSLPAGPTAFGLSNQGRMAHEIIVVRLQPQADVQEILRLDRADSSWSALREPPSGILTAEPGITTPGQLLIDLQAGERYLLVCNFRDSETAPAHLHLGMMKLVTVYGADD